MSIVNVDEYLKRIKYNGSKEPNLENLRKLCEHQAFSFPFDTLDLFGGPGKSLDLDDIYRVMVKENRGGFCYELNVMFGEFLKELGYNVAFLEGSVYKGAKQDIFYPKFNHMILKVILNDEIWIVDVGFGSSNYYLPKKLECLTEQCEVTGLYRFRKMPENDNDYILERHVKEIINVDTDRKKTKDIIISKLYNGSKNWEITLRFSLKEYIWEDFKEGWISNTTDKDCFLLKNSFIELFNKNGITILWGYKLLETKFIDPLTESIKVTEVPHSAPEDIKAINKFVQEKFGFHIAFELNKLRSDHYKN